MDISVEQQVIMGSTQHRWNVRHRNVSFQILGTGADVDVVVTSCDTNQFIDPTLWLDVDQLRAKAATEPNIEKLAAHICELYNTKTESRYLMEQWEERGQALLKRSSGVVTLEVALFDPKISDKLSWGTIPTFKITAERGQLPVAEFSNSPGPIPQFYGESHPNSRSLTEDPRTWLKLYDETKMKISRQVLVNILAALFGAPLTESLTQFTWLQTHLFTITVPETYPYTGLPSVKLNERDHVLEVPPGTLLQHVVFIERAVKGFDHPVSSNPNNDVVQT
eukprot:TRINITY_DN16847_c0_g1_i1.p1 TRINITY_DN16847_c0_g1~~TRINITY_DN16847_c0_g1_i1.p1  ORF type:complete len:279 (+),score=54.57 TRINITY_DN16847_c0_g1_i1:104-940(+)